MVGSAIDRTEMTNEEYVGSYAPITDSRDSMRAPPRSTCVSWCAQVHSISPDRMASTSLRRQSIRRKCRDLDFIGGVSRPHRLFVYLGTLPRFGRSLNSSCLSRHTWLRRRVITRQIASSTPCFLSLILVRVRYATHTGLKQHHPSQMQKPTPWHLLRMGVCNPV